MMLRIETVVHTHRPWIGLRIPAVALSILTMGAPAFAGDISPLSPRYQAALEAARQDPSAAAATPAVPAPTRIRVKYRDNAAAAAQAFGPGLEEAITSAAGAAVARREPTERGTETIVLDRSLSERQLERVVEDVEANSAVEWAVVEKIEQPQQSDDPLSARQWHYFGEPGGVKVAKAWEAASGRDVVVAVLDTGVRPHEDIRHQLLPGFDFVADPLRANDGDGRDVDATDPGDWCPSRFPQISSWHGLHVAGTVAAVTDNEVGGAGVAPQAKILPVRVLGQCGGSSFDITDAIRWAAGAPVEGVPDNPHPAQVINLSLGGFGPCDADYAEAIREARSRGATVVAAAGNSDVDASSFRPANCEGVVTVAATNRQGGLASFGGPGRGSNFGPTVDIAAPGGETFRTLEDGVLSTIDSGIREPEGDSYEAYNGTSMAAPHVAGVAALVYQIDPTIGPDEMIGLLQSTSRPFPETDIRRCSREICGAGIVDANAAVAAALERATTGEAKVARSEAGGVDPAAAAENELLAAINSGRLELPTEVAVPEVAQEEAVPVAAAAEGPDAAAATGLGPARETDFMRRLTAAQTRDVEDRAFPLTSARWPNGVAFVCWENPSPENEEGRRWTREAVANTWERHSGLQFLGWGACTDTFSGIRIRIADEGPHVKFLGKYLAYDAEGGQTVVRDGMVLNFDFNAPPEFAGCRSRREDCIRTLAVHEFGHAIGFAHEHNRPDTPSECTKPAQGPDGDTIALTPWDPESCMNYCNKEGEDYFCTELSKFDVLAVQHIYGPASSVTQR